MKKIIITTIILGLLSIITKVMGFFKEILIAKYYGTSKVLDEYLLLMTIPNFILNVLMPGLGILIITKMINFNDDNFQQIKGKKTFHFPISNSDIKFISFILTTILLMNVFIMAIVGNGNQIIFKYILLTSISVLYFIQVAFTYIFQSTKEFYIGYYGSAIQFILSITIIIFGFGVISSSILLLVSLCLALIFEVLFISIYFSKQKIKFVRVKKVENNYSKNLFVAVISLGIVEIIFSITKLMAYFLGVDGKVSSINYAYKIMNFPLSIVLLTLLTVVFPEFSKMEKGKKIKELYKLTNRLTHFLLISLGLISIFTYLNAHNIVETLFFRGEFTYRSVNQTSLLLKSIYLVIPLVGLISIIVRVRLVEKKNKEIWLAIFLGVLTLVITQTVSIVMKSELLFDMSITISFFLMTIMVGSKLLVNRFFLTSIIILGSGIVVYYWLRVCMIYLTDFDENIISLFADGILVLLVVLLTYLFSIKMISQNPK
ncbi:lipid II flippase MurJ [Sporosarcina limicola]|uniref:Peptidoglycan lipid II flippase n=1 Tax=Sporosarcina limicola TaxID=34101 RepID=A0A927MS86_9BACL|nr:lipid II flippase MurJ [Sporosarcina limicola]MBE1556421.1 putative peptidoglycan lipid II flippase [Sporosarcina limicola]